MCEVFLGLGEEQLGQMLRHISLGKLRTFQMFDAVRIRLHLTKMNQEALKKSAPKLWVRLQAGEENLASDLSQAILVSHIDMIIAILNLLGVPHEDGFFQKDADVKSYLSDGWQDRAYAAFCEKHPAAVLVFYLNHLAHEVDENGPLYKPRLN
jgi:hypothetical protein